LCFSFIRSSHSLRLFTVLLFLSPTLKELSGISIDSSEIIFSNNMAAHMAPMSSTTDMSKFILKNLLKKGTDIIDIQNRFLTQVTGLEWGKRLQIYREKAKNNKLTVKEHLEIIDELVRNHDAKYLEDPRYKEARGRIAITGTSLVDSEGYFDLTDFFGTNVFFQNIPFTEKLKVIFISIDENGDGSLSRPEVEKFF